MTQPLNASLFRDRRERLGLTERSLAKQTGVSITTVRALERGSNHLELRVRFLLRLADVLGIQNAELFDAPVGPPGQAPTTDDAKLEALLHQHGAVAHRSSLVRALGWTPNRLRDAERRLAARLAGTGVWLQSHWGLAIWPSSQYVTAHERAELARFETARRTIDVGQARLLRRLVAGELDSAWLAKAGNAERVLLGQLVNQGWAERGPHGYQPTREVIASFRPALKAIEAAATSRR